MLDLKHLDLVVNQAQDNVGLLSMLDPKNLDSTIIKY
jgi:hypothetical protein